MLCSRLLRKRRAHLFKVRSTFFLFTGSFPLPMNGELCSTLETLRTRTSIHQSTRAQGAWSTSHNSPFSFIHSPHSSIELSIVTGRFKKVLIASVWISGLQRSQLKSTQRMFHIPRFCQWTSHGSTVSGLQYHLMWITLKMSTVQIAANNYQLACELKCPCWLDWRTGSLWAEAIPWVYKLLHRPRSGSIIITSIFIFIII